jgi:non-reducing end alpha-L-arabinofuranosidase
MRTSRVFGPLIPVVVSLVAAACADADNNPLPVSPVDSSTGGVSTGAPTSTSPQTTTTSPQTTTTSPQTTTTSPQTSSTATNTSSTATNTSSSATSATSSGTNTSSTGVDPTSADGTESTTEPMSSDATSETSASTSGETGETSGPPAGRTEGPCDIFNAAGDECVAAYSTIRALLSTYDGPLYQVRSGSNVMNTGTGGETHDIGMTADGFADIAAHDAACAGTLCTISKLYDQSGHGNHLGVAKKGQTAGGATAAEDDWESVADDEMITVGGHDVYSLYMEKHQGYRQTIKGDGIPRGREAQGIYMLADGTRRAEACCWDFGNVTENPLVFHEMNTLFFGKGYWGVGAGDGPWFMNDFEAGVWAGGTNAGDPGWGSLNGAHPPNPNNPSLPVKYAIGYTKTDGDADKWALSMADLSTADELTVAFEGGLPRDGNNIKGRDNQGAIVLGVGGDNSNNSWGTFYEGAVVAGYPLPATELAVMQNVKAAGYGQ